LKSFYINDESIVNLMYVWINIASCLIPLFDLKIMVFIFSLFDGFVRAQESLKGFHYKSAQD